MYQKMNQSDLAILDFQNCIIWYKLAILLNPSKAKGYLNLGVVYMRFTKNFGESLLQLNRAIACGADVLIKTL
jgi:tetratricopeptide (TPR) repeat protein